MADPKPGKHRILTDVDVDAGLVHLLDSAAVVRQISRARLVSRLIETIARDGMFEAVLDDGSRPTPPGPGERKPRRMSERHRAPNFGTLPVSTWQRPRRIEPTKGELRSQLTEAVLNTGGVRSPTPGEVPAPSSHRPESVNR